MTKLQDKFADLSPARKAALFDTLRKKRQAADGPARIGRRASASPPPLSFGQLRLWFLDRLAPGDPTYSLPSATRIRGPLHFAHLARAIAGVAGRHEALRTTFGASGGDEPVQVIAPHFEPRLPVIDLRELPGGRRDAELELWMEAEANLPFDLERGPLLRTCAFRLADDELLFLAVMHHSVSDGWSMGVLVYEVGTLYKAFLDGKPSPLPELPIQYADFATWERATLQGEKLDALIEIWRRRLADAPAALPLPADRPRPPLKTSTGGGFELTFPPRVAARLAAVASPLRATAFMGLLAAWNAILARWSGATDLVVGTPIANRRLETANLIGFFVNTLAVRTDLSGDPTFEELIARVREVALEAFAHQTLPFEKLVEELRPERDASRTPLFQVMCSLQNTPKEAVELDELRLETVGSGRWSAKFDLSLNATEEGEDLFGSMTYWAEIFEAATMERLGRHFIALLGAALETPGQRISRLPILEPAEIAELTNGWSTPALPGASAWTGPVLLPERIAAWAALDPERPAVRGEDGEITYGELRRRAAELAGHLRALGVGPEVRVAVTGARRASTVVAIVAVLEAGGAYVPLDPALPEERRAALLQEAGCVAWLASLDRTDPADPTDLSDLFSTPGLALRPLVPVSPAPPLPVLPENAAYVLFTSGSTGTPKGVVVEHRQLVQYVEGAIAALGLPQGVPGTPGTRYALVSTFAADLGHTSLFPSLVTGGCLDVVPEAGVLDPEVFVRHLDRYPADCLKIVPSHLAALLSSSRPAAALPRRRLILGGEATSSDLALRLRELAPDLAVFNHYGPTETTVGAIAGPLGAPFPLGRPLPGAHILLLGTAGELVPPGVVGEIHIGGGGVARGYLGRPGLTAERFVPDPLPGRAGSAGGRLYRTGDLARLTPGGLVWLGRADHQVKIRGFRVEPGEIEAALLRQEGVREAVVLVHEDGPGDRRLVGYVVLQEGHTSTPTDLRSALRRSLPEAMVPSDVVLLDKLPLTANGKVDRRALARSAPEAVREAARFIAPQGPTEEMLAEIWAEVLGTGRLGPAARVGAHDDFFILGGHSLLATRVISRVRETFGVEVPLRALFEAPTVAELAVRIGQEGIGWIGSIDPITRSRRSRHTGDLPLSFAQQRLWFLDRLAPDNPFYNVFNPLRLSGALDVAALGRAFREIVLRHEGLRTTFPETAGRPRQVIDPAAEFRLPLVDLATLPEAGGRAELTRLLREEAGRPFQLARGPLFRATLVRHAPGEHTLLVNLHHVISDGWSMGILFAEIAALYGAFCQGRPSPLPDLPIQYADFALWQRDFLQGERLAAELEYWREQLAGLPESLELPTDHPRPIIDTFRGALRTFTLPVELVRALTGLTRRRGATRSMTMLAGFQALLGRWAGQEDLATGAVIANRTRREVEGLIGFFVNTLVLRSDLSPSSGFGALLGRVRETALAAYAHQDLPFERLVEELQPERSQNRNPLIQVVFSYQNFPRSEAEVQGLVLSVPDDVRVGTGTAKFDLTLFLFEDGDRLQGALEFNRGIFEEATVQRLLAGFENLLTAAVAAPEAPLGRLPWLTAAEMHQLVREWNDTGTAWPATASLAELFTAQVRRTPDAIAVTCGDGALSYGELDRRSQLLAHRLRAQGVGPESRVGLCIERSLELVVGLLGILQAGGAYVPLDPGYPRERLAYMIEDAGVEVVVGTQEAVTVLPDTTPRILLDTHEPLETLPAGDRELRVDGANLAYVIYTSGSTGRPKGALVTHGNVARLFAATEAWFDFTERDVWTLFHSYAFDFSVWEIWGALLYGGRLVIVPWDVSRSPELFLDLLTRERVTVLNQTPSAFSQLARMDEERGGLPADLRLVVFGGEALDTAGLASWFARHGDTQPRLVNMYGITETTVHVTFRPLRAADARGERRSVIGVPIPDLFLAVMDRGLQPVPIGVPGELVIGGAGLARGYLGRPELTADRFVPDPAGGTAGGRLYRSGDLGRFLSRGEVEYLGRIDHQVKIRGFRIELGEIEARLAEHPEVFQALVLAREDRSAGGAPGDRRLVAYVRQREAAAPETGDDQVSGWSELFDDIYREEAAGADPTFNVIGWNSTYSGEPLPRADMVEWLDDTIGRIAGLDPHRVLEIGCGTGMILWKIAPRAEIYTGTDVSAKALAYIESQLGRVPGIDPARIQLVQGSAEELGDLEDGTFDTAIINSVAQYFPSADYLAAVIARLVELVRPGGAIFLGDLRSLPLLEAFHTSLELFQAEPEMPLERLRQKIQTRRLQENELAIDPAFFTTLRHRLPGIGRVEIHAKRGRAHNELTGFRYQAVLRLGEPKAAQEIAWLDWDEERLTFTGLRRLLEQTAPEILGLRNIPNARTAEAAAAVRLLREEKGTIQTAGELRRQAAEAAVGAVDPQDLWDLGAELPYEIELSWASPGAAGRFEVVLRRSDSLPPGVQTPGYLEKIVPEGTTPPPAPFRGRFFPGSQGFEPLAEAGAASPLARLSLSALLPEPEIAPAAQPLSSFTNDPLQGRFARRLAPELRAFLKDRLPEYMVPSAFVLLDAFPLTPNGKVDRRRLPAPDGARPEAGPSLTLPRTATEETLLEIWKELLGTARIGVDDDFFELGGHSLLATQAVSRIRAAFGLEIPLRSFFETSTVAEVAAALEAQRGGAEEQAPAIVPVPRRGDLPLSFAQERLWFLQRLAARSLAYNESAAFRMEGRLDVAAFRGSLDDLLRRHESLRTTFPEVDGRAVQEIHEPAPFEIPSVDLSGLSADLRDDEARRLARAQALRPFDLARGPLVRGLLVRLGAQDYAVLFSFHHVVFDGWSIGLFVRELSALYAARLAGRLSPLPPLAIQYADFAAWQRHWLQGEVLARLVAWWRGELAGVAVLDLPTDRPRPALPQAASGQRSLVLSPDLTRALRELSRSRGTTLFMTLLAGFQALLRRTTGQDDIAAGTPIAGRNRSEIEPLIGFFINMLVLRTRLAGDPGFTELLEGVRQTALGAYAHQDLPFEKLVEELRPTRSLRHTPLFQVSFQLLNVPTSYLDLPGLTLHPFPFAARSTKFDLNLNWTDQGEQLSGLLDYDSDLFDATTAERLLVHLHRLLEGAVASPGTRLSDLPLLTAAEQIQIVQEWNDTAAVAPEARIHELFEVQAERTPEAVALVFEGEELSYSDLNARANQLAHLLRRWGVGPGVLVGLRLERSFEMMVGLLGILKAGGAYVPLDPAYPQERLAFMLADAQVQVLLTQEALTPGPSPASGRGERVSLGSRESRDDLTYTPLPLAGEGPGVRALHLDASWIEIAAESTDNLPPQGNVDDLAYVIYTSGSTGRPKGAMNSHRAAVNRLRWQQEMQGLATEDRVLQKTPISFDVSVWELFLPLAIGARLVLARPGGHQDPAYLAQLIAREGITTAHFVPSLLEVFLETQDIAACTSLRRVVCSGEALSAALARRFFDAHPAGEAPALDNLYGPTEAAVDVTAWRCLPGFALDTVPIGRPAANTVTYVLDAHLRPVPIGIPGELYLGGVQLARGYHARPELTAERFVPDPFADGGRLYRTGDQVRLLASGEIVYLGRLDHQVKIRGVRIELGEIEAAISALAGVRQTVAVVREDRLVAYVVGDAPEDALARQLRERLPEAMIPTAFVRLDALPLLPNGKVDRKALPAPDRGPALDFVAPRTPEESLLAEIWAELLGLEQVGAGDNFFDRGGHSLLAVLLMARIEKRFGKAFPLGTLFSHPTLESLAALLALPAPPASGPRPLLVTLQPRGDRAPFVCVHPVGGNVLCYLDLARHLGPDQPFHAFQAPSPGDGLDRPTIEQMAARYLEELRRVQPHGPYRLGGWSIGGLIAFEMARQLARDGDTPELVALIDTLPPAPVAEPSDDELVAAFARDLARLLGHDVGISPEELRPLPAREKLAHVMRLGHAARLLPEDFGVVELEPLFTTFATNLRASRLYDPEPYPGRLHLWLSEQTLATVTPDLPATWNRLALGGVETTTLPGDHYSLLRQPRVERLARELARKLGAPLAADVVP